MNRDGGLQSVLGVRSMSVGDIVMGNEGMLVCNPFGWRKLSEREQEDVLHGIGSVYSTPERTLNSAEG